MASTNHANAVSNASLQFSSLLGCTLESMIHELLYSRSIYPPDSYIHSRHLGVRFHCSRVPQVCEYISNFLKVAVPSIISGVGDSISLVILEEEVVTSCSQDVETIVTIDLQGLSEFGPEAQKRLKIITEHLQIF